MRSHDCSFKIENYVPPSSFLIMLSLLLFKLSSAALSKNSGDFCCLLLHSSIASSSSQLSLKEFLGYSFESWWYCFLKIPFMSLKGVILRSSWSSYIICLNLAFILGPSLCMYQRAFSWSTSLFCVDYSSWILGSILAKSAVSSNYLGYFTSIPNVSSFCVTNSTFIYSNPASSTSSPHY